MGLKMFVKDGLFMLQFNYVNKYTRINKVNHLSSEKLLAIYTNGPYGEFT